jgi:hypothetical protein
MVADALSSAAVLRALALRRAQAHSQLMLLSWSIVVVTAVVLPLFVFLDQLAAYAGNHVTATLLVAATISAMTVALGYLAVGLEAGGLAALAVGATVAVSIGPTLHDVAHPAVAPAAEAADAAQAPPAPTAPSASQQLIADSRLDVDPAACRPVRTRMAGALESVFCDGVVGPGSSVVATQFDSPERMIDAYRARRAKAVNWEGGRWWHIPRRVVGRWWQANGTARTVLATYDREALLLVVAVDADPGRDPLDLESWRWPGS